MGAELGIWMVKSPVPVKAHEQMMRRVEPRVMFAREKKLAKDISQDQPKK
jgi:hypothetical protein